MTLSDLMVKNLESYGLWPDEAAEIVAAESKQADLADITWDRDANEYPLPLQTVLLMRLMRVSVEWIDANKPAHFARAILAGEV